MLAETAALRGNRGVDLAGKVQRLDPGGNRQRVVEQLELEFAEAFDLVPARALVIERAPGAG